LRASVLASDRGRAMLSPEVALAKIAPI